ncbi:uncharacterized protein si:dkey-262k9.2 [Hemibagrus wyckioides]|nr:uncharacterized protein si:dkey-262k9.2 [Hemibagrus wyckioides]XP_058269546.1 uncharacterized protein si:dkey-262k9.2 [Hemibagrus wyckioides]XP_058269547.1 uncharacterized protein si:dkey-262k9.2 [Hemibagrus wyckioides]
MMLRLFLLTLLLTVKAFETDTDGSGYVGDDEEDEETQTPGTHLAVKNEFSNVDHDDGSTTIIIIAAVSVVTLAIVAIIAVILFKRHLQRREQGVYSVPVEQGQKCI